MNRKHNDVCLVVDDIPWCYYAIPSPLRGDDDACTDLYKIVCCMPLDKDAEQAEASLKKWMPELTIRWVDEVVHNTILDKSMK